MDRNRNSESPGGFNFTLVRFRRSGARTACSKAHGNQTIILLPSQFFLDALDIGKIRKLFRLLLQDPAITVRKTRADAGFAERAKIGIGVRGSREVM